MKVVNMNVLGNLRQCEMCPERAGIGGDFSSRGSDNLMPFPSQAGAVFGLGETRPLASE